MELTTHEIGSESSLETGTSIRGPGHRLPGRGALATTALAAAFLLAACGGAGDGAEAGSETEGELQTDTTVATGTGQETGQLLNPNEATEEQLRAIEGLPEPAATALLEGRPYADVLVLDQTLSAHVDSASRAELYRSLWIPIDLNEASDEAILLIPGVGDRMLGEFKEYRPYQAMAEFRREMGKYVDDDEVSRLEAYVTLEEGL